MADNTFDKLLKLKFTHKQETLCKENDIDINEQYEIFKKWHLDKKRTRKSYSMAFSRWLNKNPKIELSLAKKKVFTKNVIQVMTPNILEQGIETTKDILSAFLNDNQKKNIIYDQFILKVIEHYGKIWKSKDKEFFIESAVEETLKNLPSHLLNCNEEQLLDYCKGYFKHWFVNYESQYMPNGLYIFKKHQLDYNNTLKPDPDCLKSLTFTGVNSHIKIRNKEITLLEKYLPNSQKFVIHTLFYIANNPTKAIFGKSRYDYEFKQIQNITGLQFETY